MKTTTKIRLAWKYRRALWKYRNVIQHRWTIAAAATAGALVAAGMLLERRRVESLPGAVPE